MKTKFKLRIKKIRKYLTENKKDACIVFSNSDTYYLTNFFTTENIALLLITKQKLFFITDGRFVNQFNEQVKGYTLKVADNKNIFSTCNNIIKSENLKNIIVPYSSISHQNFLDLLNDLNIEFYDSDNLILNYRSIKDPKEIIYIKKAAEISQKALKKTMKKIKPGLTEIQIRDILENEMKKLGSEYVAFPTIVASGPINGASPHAIPTSRKVKKGDFITIDFGATYKNYRSDNTRTFALGRPNKKIKKVYQTTLTAKKECEKLLSAGVECKKINECAEKIINEFGQPFMHSIGHGIGIDIHEEPSLNKSTDQKLKEGAVHTIEPGIYIPKLCGVRIEDDYLITKRGCVNLTNKITDDLIII